jgi:hypothetical protein
LSGIEARVTALEHRVGQAEAGKDILVSEAKAAATAAATMVAGAVVSDAVTRVTRLEEAVKQVRPEARRLARDGASTS